MRIPKKVKIGPHTWKVQRPKFIRADRDMQKFDQAPQGTCSASRHIIQVKKGIPESQGAEIFLHEILHALMDGIRISPTLEEQVVSKLGSGLLQVIRDNQLRFEVE